MAQVAAHDPEHCTDNMYARHVASFLVLCAVGADNLILLLKRIVCVLLHGVHLFNLCKRLTDRSGSRVVRIIRHLSPTRAACW